MLSGIRCFLKSHFFLRVMFCAPLCCAPLETIKAKDLRWRWVYASCNFQNSTTIDDLISMMRRAKKAGYNGMVISDWKWGRFAGRAPYYYENLRQTKKAADEIGIELIPIVINVGYSSSILSNNPNLAEGIAVKDSVFAVRNGKATIANTKNTLPFGGFEEAKNNTPLGWDSVDGPGKSVFHDRVIKHMGEASVRMENYYLGNKYGICRLSKKLLLLPWQQYRLGLFIKTKNVDSPEMIKVIVSIGGGRALNYSSLCVKQTQDWTKHEVMFNTLGNSEVRLWIGSWGPRAAEYGLMM